MARIFDARLADYADDLRNIIGTHEELLREYEEKRLIFNAQYKKVLQKKIKPVVHQLMETANNHGHWFDTDIRSDEQYRDYVHQTYTITWKCGGTCTLSIVAKHDYNKVFFIVSEYPDRTTQQGLELDMVDPEQISKWLMAALPTL